MKISFDVLRGSKKKQRCIWEFLNSKVGILLLGFTMTTVVGGFFAD